MTISRDSRVGRGYIAREGDTGSVVWASSRDALAVSKGAARMSVGGRPGQLVFSDGTSVFGAGESRYPQDVAYICSGDGIPASIYAGRYLAKWPLENDLLASEGYDPRAFTGTTYFGSPAYVFTTKDGKRCIGGIPEVSGSYTALLPSAWRTKGLTYSVSVYANSLHDPIAGRGIMLLNTGAPFAGDIWNQSGNRGFQVFINGGYLQLATFSLAELLDVWSHYVISVSPAGIVKGYRNGVLVGAASTTANICYSVSSITGSVYATPSTGESQAFYRNMRAYGYALTDAEVAAISAEDLA